MEPQQQHEAEEDDQFTILDKISNTTNESSEAGRRESRIPKEALVWVKTEHEDEGVDDELTEDSEGEEEGTTLQQHRQPSTKSFHHRLQQYVRRPMSTTRNAVSHEEGEEDGDKRTHTSLTFNLRNNLNLLINNTSPGSSPWSSPRPSPNSSPRNSRAPTKYAIKEIIFIRHGQSLGQCANKKDRRTLHSLTDANLSEKGISQAQMLSTTLHHESMTKNEGNDFLVVCSPLTRAIRTAAMVFPHDNTRIVIHPGFAELNNPGNAIPENTGRSLELLMADDTVRSILTNPRVDYSRITSTEDWPAAEGARELDHVDNMLRFLMSRPEQRICVVTHHHFIYSLFPTNFLPKYRHSRKAPARVRNCFPIHTVVSDKPSIRVSDELHDWLYVPKQHYPTE